MADDKADNTGIAGLPKVWAVAVQLVGTFGLAVFLVLYYVLVLQPAEAARYATLAESVNELMEAVRARQALITRDQADRLRELYVDAASGAVVRVLLDAREQRRGGPDLAREIENELLLRTDLLRDLRREDGGVLSEQLGNILRVTEIPQRLAASAEGEWRELPPRELILQCRNALQAAIRAVARAK